MIQFWLIELKSIWNKRKGNGRFVDRFDLFLIVDRN